MKIDYTGRKAELSDRERGKLQRKLDKVQRILSRRADLEAHVILSRQRHLFEAEVTLRALRHTLVVGGNGVTAFSAMHVALEKLEKQAVRNKHKIIDTHRPGRQRGRPSVLVRDALQSIAGSLAADGSSGARGRVRIVRSRGVEPKPMTAEEALMELEESQREYVAFRDADSGRIQVLVRCRDGSAELVEGG